MSTVVRKWRKGLRRGSAGNRDARGAAKVLHVHFITGAARGAGRAPCKAATSMTGFGGRAAASTIRAPRCPATARATVGWRRAEAAWRADVARRLSEWVQEGRPT